MSTLDPLTSIFAMRTGQHLSSATSEARHEFLRELLECRRRLIKSKRKPVTAAALRNWVLPHGTGRRVSTPKRHDAISFLMDYLYWLADVHPKIVEANADAINSIKATLRSIIEPSHKTIFNPNIPFESADELFLHDHTVLAVVRSLVYASTRNTRSERDDLFRGGADDGEDASYYVMYRYSTNRGDVLKSYIEFRTPDDGSNTFSFNHCIWGGRDPHLLSIDSMNSHIFRETEGAIAKFDTSYYLIGYHFNVPVNKREHLGRYNIIRNKRRERPEGLEFIAIEYDTIRQNPGLMSGLIMTLAANQQPVIARVALLHVGTRTGLGVAISDETIRPKELSGTDLADDLVAMVDTIRDVGIASMSEFLQILTSDCSWGETGARSLADAILNYIDNTPAWELKTPTRRAHHARGALETIGKPERPRD